MDTTESPPQLELRDIAVRFGGITALDQVNLTARTGEVLGIIGPNGAGKTTLFNVVCGFVPATSGSVRRMGSPVHPTPRKLAASGIARTLQEVGLCERLSVLENVMLGADRTERTSTWSALFGLSGKTESALRDRALEALTRVDAQRYAQSMPMELPYPVRKRIALARAIASEPDLLLLDEPAGGLGEEDIEHLTDFVQWNREAGRTIVLVEHHMDFVMNVCDQVAVLDFGRVIAQGPPTKIAGDAHVAEAYLGMVAR